MATTTNYSWTTPDDTDLVKDGAAAIRTLGSSADTTVKALNPGTTAGDIDYYTTSTAKARVGIGTAGQVLTVNSGATAPEWGTAPTGGMTVIASGSLTGASVDLTSIPGTNNNLQLVLSNISSTLATDLRITLNNDTGSNYARVQIRNATVSMSATATSFSVAGAQMGTTGAGMSAIVNVYNYANSTSRTIIDANAYKTSSTADQVLCFGGFDGTAAITSLQIIAGTSTFNTGTYILYGVK